MTYTVVASSRIYSSDDINTQRTDFKLPLTEFRDVRTVQLPNVLNFNLEENTTFTVDLTQHGTYLRILALKSTRPVGLELVTAQATYTYPPMTYFQQLYDSPEPMSVSPTALNIIVPAAATASISPAPPRYPRALVELFVFAE
jgi:hypothetical protein